MRAPRSRLSPYAQGRLDAEKLIDNRYDHFGDRRDEYVDGWLDGLSDREVEPADLNDRDADALDADDA